MPNVPMKIPMTMGVNRFLNPRSIDDTEVVSAQNVAPHEPGMPRTRKGVMWAKDLGFFDAGRGMPTVYPFGACLPPKDLEVDIIAAFRNFGSSYNTTLNVWSGGAVAAYYDLGAVTNRRPQFVFYDGKMIIVTGGQPLVLTKHPDGTFTVDPLVFQGEQATAPTPTAACTYHGRMVYAQGRTIWFSDLHDPTLVGDDVLAANGTNILIKALGDDEIIAMTEVYLSAENSPADTALLILGRNKAFMMRGDTSETTDTGADYQGTAEMHELQNVQGTPSAETLVRTRYGVMWVSDEDVWGFDVGKLPRRVGTKIRPVLQASPADKRYLWHAAYFDGFYRLGVFSEGQGPTDDSPCGEQWWMDLRDGMPEDYTQARWWGPQLYSMFTVLQGTPRTGTYPMAVEFRDGRERALYGVEPMQVLWDQAFYSYAGTPGYALVQYDVTDSRDYAVMTSFDTQKVSPSFTGDPGASVAFQFGNEIVPLILSKAYDFGDRMVDKLYQGLEMSVYVSDLCRLYVDVILDGGKYIDTCYQTVDQTGIVGGVAVVGPNASHEFQSILLPPDAAERYAGKVVQLRISTIPGFPVTTNNQYVMFQDQNDGVWRTVTIPAGFYGSRQSLMTAIVNAVNADSISRGALLRIGSTTHTDGTAEFTTTAGVGIYFEFRQSPDFPGAVTTSTRKLGRWLGFGDSMSAIGAEGTPQTAAPLVEFADILFTVYPFGRRPS